jgi:EPS-associated MarR family transcriptional regulator
MNNRTDSLKYASSQELDHPAMLEALRVLAEQPQVSQRGLSQRLGLSLGKTHYVLHALLDAGLVKIQNFRRNDNKLGYVYLLTPKGLREKLRLTRDFLHRKEAEFERLQETIERLRQEIRGDAPAGDADSSK